MTVALAAETVAIIATDRSCFTKYQNGRVERQDVGRTKLARTRDGGVATIGGDAHWGYPMLHALREVAAPNEPAVAAVVRRATAVNPPVTPSHVSLVFHDGERFRARVFRHDDAGLPPPWDGEEGDTEALIGWPKGWPEERRGPTAQEFERDLSQEIADGGGVEGVVRAVGRLFQRVADASDVVDEVAVGMILSSGRNGRRQEREFTTARRR